MNNNPSIRDEHRDMFLKLKKLILSFDGMKLRQSANQNAFYSKCRVVVMVRSTSNEDYLTTSWGQGAKLEEKFKVFTGNGKYVRHIRYHNIEEIDEELLKELIAESIILNMEALEMLKIKNHLKNL